MQRFTIVELPAHLRRLPEFSLHPFRYSCCGFAYHPSRTRILAAGAHSAAKNLAAKCVIRLGSDGHDALGNRETAKARPKWYDDVRPARFHHVISLPPTKPMSLRRFTSSALNAGNLDYFGSADQREGHVASAGLFVMSLPSFVIHQSRPSTLFVQSKKVSQLYVYLAN